MEKDAIVTMLRQIISLADECLGKLDDSAPIKKETKKKTILPRRSNLPTFDFSKSMRAFFNEYGKHMIGPQIFVLILCRLVEGDETKTATLEDIKDNWNRLRTIISSPYNRMQALRARDNDWVKSDIKGIYQLRPKWKEIFSDSDK